MSDRQPADSPNPRLNSLAAEFSRLEPADQDLVLAIVARLRSGSDETSSAPPFKPDVPFMDFLE